MNWKAVGANAITLALVLVAQTAQADDVPKPIYKNPSPLISYYNWTGFYLGGNAGFGLSRTTNASGFVTGGTVGYNLQMGAAVIGFEGDYDWSNIEATSTLGACAASATGCKTNNNWIATVRGRIGYALGGRLLPYLTGGLAYGNVKTSADFGSDTFNRTGYAVGAGLEYAFAGNWSAKLEYLYVDLSDHSCGTACGSPPIPLAGTFKENFVRMGLNYKFSGPSFQNTARR